LAFERGEFLKNSGKGAQGIAAKIAVRDALFPIFECFLSSDSYFTSFPHIF